MLMVDVACYQSTIAFISYPTTLPSAVTGEWKSSPGKKTIRRISP